MSSLSFRARTASNLKAAALLLLVAALPACASLGSSGPSSQAINGAKGDLIEQSGIQIIDVTDAVTRRTMAASKRELFSEAFGDAPAVETMIQRGDVVGVTIY